MASPPPSVTVLYRVSMNETECVDLEGCVNGGGVKWPFQWLSVRAGNRQAYILLNNDARPPGSGGGR